MMFYPEVVSMDDPAWRAFAGLLTQLPLDTRKRTRSGQLEFVCDADAYLFQPERYDKDRRCYIKLDLYGFLVRTGANVGCVGSIPISDEAALGEFRTRINASLAGDLTQAEQQYWSLRQPARWLLPESANAVELRNTAWAPYMDAADELARIGAQSINSGTIVEVLSRRGSEALTAEA